MTPLDRRTLLRASPLAVAGGLVGAGVGANVVPAAAADRRLHIGCWDRAGRFGAGAFRGVRVDSRGGLVLGGGLTQHSYDDPFGPRRSYEYGNWTSQWITPGFGADELIASWNATTPAGTWVEVAMQAITTSGATTRWYVMGRWASGDAGSDIHRTSVNGSSDTYGGVSTDTFRTRGGHRIRSYRIRVTMFRTRGTSATPRVALVFALASALPKGGSVPTSPSGPARGTVLGVPAYSQQLHRGHYPQYGGGGEAWCSPTCTAMVLDYWKSGPSGSLTGWVDDSDPRPQVDHVARSVYDYTYSGCGNWPFNTAYAGARGLRSFVTRLRSLQEAERFIAAGIPLIASVSFSSSELTGAGYSTNGHLLVIIGFTGNGDVVVNDPASHLQASDRQVRVTYRRGQFENVWVPRSGGVVYVMAPWGHALPPTSVPGQPNWG